MRPAEFTRRHWNPDVGRRRTRLWLATSEGLAVARSASPIIAIGIMSMALALTDLLMIARLDPDGLPAVVLVSDLYSIILNFTVGFTGVLVPQIARAIGAKVPWQVCTTVKRTLLLAIILSIGGALLIGLVGGRAGGALAPGGQKVASAYALYMSGAYICLVAFGVGRLALGAMGQSRFAVAIMVAVVPANAAANLVCMNGAFGWNGVGAAGAGLASLVVSAIMAAAMLCHLFRSRSLEPYRGPRGVDRLWDRRALAAQFVSGLALGLGSVAETGVFLLSTIVVGMLATPHLAAHALAFRAMGGVYILLAGMGQATTIRVAFLLGRDALQISRHARSAAACGAGVLSVALVVGFTAFSDGLGAGLAQTVAGSGAELAQETARLLPLAGLALAAAIPAHMVCAMARASGEVGRPMVLLAAGHWGVGLPLMVCMATSGYGAEGVWIGLSVGGLAASLGCVAYATKAGKPSRWMGAAFIVPSFEGLKPRGRGV